MTNTRTPRSLAQRIASRAPSVQQKASGRWTQPRSTFRVPSRSRRRAGRIRSPSTEDALEELTERVADENVTLLNTRCRGRRNAKAQIAKIAHLPAALACHADDSHVLFAGNLDGSHDVPAVAARRDREQDVPRAPVGTHLACEDFVVAVVVR